MRLSLIPSLFFLLAVFAKSAQAEIPGVPLEPEAGGWIGLPIYLDPELTVPPSSVSVDPRLDGLWLKAMGRPEVELRINAAMAFAAASRYGMTPSAEAARKLRDMATGDPDTQVRYEAVKTLVAIDDREAGDLLLARLKDEPREQVVQEIDRALTAWRAADAYEAWGQRVADPAGSLALRRSAADALGETAPQSVAGAPALVAVATSSEEPTPLRLDAAAAVGRMRDLAAPGSLARLAGNTTVDRLVVARMLSGLSGADVEPLNRQLLNEEDGVVVAEAVAAMGRRGGALTEAELPRLAGHGDERVRYETTLRMLEQRGQAVDRLLVGRLDDASVRVRFTAMQALLAHHDDSAADASTREAIERGVAGLLDSPNTGWRGLEQAALLAGRFDMEGSWRSLTKLLWHERTEVRLAAADALRRVEVAEALPEMLRRAEELTDTAKKMSAAALSMEPAPAIDAQPGVSFSAIDDETAQLFMAFGAMKYAAADALMRRYIPKSSGFGPMGRAAAADALGRLYEGQAQAQAELVRLLIGRVMDRDEMNPEMPEVQRFGAIALGRMKATDQVDKLRRAAVDPMLGLSDITIACRWAVLQISGQQMEEPEVLPHVQKGWFLEPLD